MPDVQQTHVGLNNIYRWLRMCYGENVQVDFFSVPFVLNSITITIGGMIAWISLNLFRKNKIVVIEEDDDEGGLNGASQ